MKQKSYDHILEAMQYYAKTEQCDELCGIVALLEQRGFSSDTVFHLLGDVYFLNKKKEDAKIAYQKAAQFYQQSGKVQQAEALQKVIARIG